MKNVYILGAAGSIGLQTLDVIKSSNNQFQLIGISLGSNHEINFSILDFFKVEICCLRSESHLEIYQKKYPMITFVYGEMGLLKIASYPKPGILLNALSGSSGLNPTVFAISSKKDIALANKETLVMAGSIIKDLVQKYQVKLLPVDSEHSALWTVLQGETPENIQKIVITASGGSFRDLDREALKHVDLSHALSHPNWQMGAKITIDSATMMNKGLEVIEAHYLFDLPYDQIETILHKESIVHGLVYLIDGTVKACLSVSDMRIPISYALYYPNRMKNKESLSLSTLTFTKMDFDRFPLLKLAYDLGKKGDMWPTVMNAANEAAVKLFLNGDISFLDIENIVFETVKIYQPKLELTIENIIKTDVEIQQTIMMNYQKMR
jgi:1-deoxy-D-xylulose-5-phosphate reductoisomerase